MDLLYACRDTKVAPDHDRPPVGRCKWRLRCSRSAGCCGPGTRPGARTTRADAVPTPLGMRQAAEEGRKAGFDAGSWRNAARRWNC